MRAAAFVCSVRAMNLLYRSGRPPSLKAGPPPAPGVHQSWGIGLLFPHNGPFFPVSLLLSVYSGPVPPDNDLLLLHIGLFPVDNEAVPPHNDLMSPHNDLLPAYNEPPFVDGGRHSGRDAEPSGKSGAAGAAGGPFPLKLGPLAQAGKTFFAGFTTASGGLGTLRSGTGILPGAIGPRVVFGGWRSVFGGPRYCFVHVLLLPLGLV